MEVLIIEDDRSASRAMRILLVNVGWVVSEAETVLDGLHLLCNNPQWVVLDLMLKDGDGISILQRIRNAGLPIKVVVVTGTGSKERIQAVKDLRPDAILRKPIDIKELISVIGTGAVDSKLQ